MNEEQLQELVKVLSKAVHDGATMVQPGLARTNISWAVVGESHVTFAVTLAVGRARLETLSQVHLAAQAAMARHMPVNSSWSICLVPE